MTLHSRSKEQREAVRQLIYLVLTRDMATFNPDRFKHWIKETDSKFRKVGLMLKFEIRDRFVYFRIKEIRNGRIIYQFDSSTRVGFDERDVVLLYRGIESGRRLSGRVLATTFSRARGARPSRSQSLVRGLFTKSLLSIARRSRRFSTVLSRRRAGKTRQRPRSAAHHR